MGCGSSSSKQEVVPSSDTTTCAAPATPPRRQSSFADNKSAEPGPEPEPALSPETGPKSALTRPPMTFEVPIERRSGSSNGGVNGKPDSGGNIVRQYPPKRLLRLEEQQVPLTHQLLDDRLAEADLRRQKILNQRIQSAHVRKHRRRPVNVDTEWKVTGSEDTDLDAMPDSDVQDLKESNAAVT